MSMSAGVYACANMYMSVCVQKGMWHMGGRLDPGLRSSLSGCLVAEG